MWSRSTFQQYPHQCQYQIISTIIIINDTDDDDGGSRDDDDDGDADDADNPIMTLMWILLECGSCNIDKNF